MLNEVSLGNPWYLLHSLGVLVTHDLRMELRYPDTTTVLVVMLDTIGLLRFPSLCVFGSRWLVEVLVVC